MPPDSNAETNERNSSTKPALETKPSQNTTSRREFLKKTARYVGVLAATAAASRYPDIRDTVRTHKDQEELSRQIFENETFLKERYGLTVQTKLSNSQLAEGWLQFELQLSEKTDILEWTRREISKYPPEYFKNFLNFATIRILKSYYRQGQTFIEQGSLQFELDTKTGLTSHDILIAKEVFGWFDAKQFPTTFHHELRHAADGPIMRRAEIVDWENLNENGSNAYAKQGLINKLAEQVRRPDGFAEAYGRTNWLEDRATVAALLLTDPERAKELAQSDKVLATKIDKIKKDYLKTSGRRMDEKYWSDLADGKVNENYWDNQSNSPPAP